MTELEDFARVTNQEFEVSVGDSTVIMTLIDIQQLPPQQGAMRQSFALTFRSASQLVLPQQIYPMRNPGLANADTVGVFLVPVARDVHGVHYQAVFN